MKLSFETFSNRLLGSFCMNYFVLYVCRLHMSSTYRIGPATMQYSRCGHLLKASKAPLVTGGNLAFSLRIARR